MYIPVDEPKKMNKIQFNFYDSKNSLLKLSQVCKNVLRFLYSLEHNIKICSEVWKSKLRTKGENFTLPTKR